jgi:AcrR family transcriptional regulator
MSRRPAQALLSEAAFALFAERGFDATTVEEIADRAGLSRATFFRAFRSKEDVIFPDHDVLLTRIAERLVASTNETRLLAVVEAARLVLQHYLDEGDMAKQRYQLTRSVPALRQREIAGMQQYEQVFREFIRAVMGAGPLADLRAELMAGAVVTAHNHVLRSWLREETDDAAAEFDRAMREVLRLFDEPTPAEGTTVVVLRSSKDLAQVLPAISQALGE